MQYFSSSISYPYSLENIANHYHNYEKLMKYWKKAGLEVYDVEYEKLVSNPRGELSALFKFLELDYQEECLSFYRRMFIQRWVT